MTTLREAAQQALALIVAARLCEINSMSSRQEMLRLMIKATDTLRAALAEPVQEPVAKVELMTTGGNAGLATRIVEIDDHLRERLRPGQFLYTTPPHRTPLTDEEIDRVTDAQWANNNHKPIYAAHRAYARAIEAAHGIGSKT